MGSSGFLEYCIVLERDHQIFSTQKAVRDSQNKEIRIFDYQLLQRYKICKNISKAYA